MGLGVRTAPGCDPLQPRTTPGWQRVRLAIRYLEAQAAATYWNSWSDVPVSFPRQDAKRVPDHWLRFGTRHSPLTGQPRLAVNPPNAILNYSFALAESECRLALASCRLDPSMGFIHADAPYRDSLALDLLETIRPSIEAWLLDGSCKNRSDDLTFMKPALATAD